MTDRAIDDRIRAWLTSRDPGAVPETLRASTARVPVEVRPSGVDRLRDALADVRSNRSERRLAEVGGRPKMAIAAAAVVVVVIVGIRILPADGGAGASGPIASPLSSPALTAAPSVRPTSTAGSTQDQGSVGESVTLDGVPLSVVVTMLGWERHQYYVSKSIEGPQGAEAILFWAGFGGGWESQDTPPMDTPTACTDLLGPAEGASVADLAAAVSSVAGTDVVAGPSDVSVGGRAAKHVTLFVTYSILDNGAWCRPGFFYSWDGGHGGAFWDQTIPGDTIQVWIVDVDGKILFLEAETHWNAGPEVKQEIQQIVDSIRFD